MEETVLEIGILGYGVYVPRYRIKRDEYLKAWGSFAARAVDEKTVPGFDEDIVTMAVEASLNSLKRVGVDPAEINALYLASTSAPYVEKLLSSTIATALGLSNNVTVADYTSSTKAGTSALLSCFDFIASGRGKYGLAVASDCPIAKPGSSLERGFGAGASAFVIGEGKPVATVEGSNSISSEALGLRFRRDGEKYVEDSAIRPYTELVFNQIVMSNALALMEKLDRKPEHFSHIILQQFDGREPYRLGSRLGFSNLQIETGTVVSKTGDTGACSTLIGLTAVLDTAKPGERVLIVSYGSGAGSDAISILVHEGVEERRLKAPSTGDYLVNKEYVDYITYLKLRKIIGK